MLILTVLLLAAPQATDAKPRKAEPICRRAETTLAASNTRPTLHTLGAEPNGTQVLAVLRTEGGCIKPVVVSESVGSSAKP